MEILHYFPDNIKEKIKEYMENDLEEIRVRVGRPIILKFLNKEIVLIINIFLRQQQ